MINNHLTVLRRVLAVAAEWGSSARYRTWLAEGAPAGVRLPHVGGSRASGGRCRPRMARHGPARASDGPPTRGAAREQNGAGVHAAVMARYRARDAHERPKSP